MLKEILRKDVGSLLGRMRAPHKGSEKVKWGVWGGERGAGVGGQGKRTDSPYQKGN